MPLVLIKLLGTPCSINKCLSKYHMRHTQNLHPPYSVEISVVLVLGNLILVGHWMKPEICGYHLNQICFISVNTKNTSYLWTESKIVWHFYFHFSTSFRKKCITLAYFLKIASKFVNCYDFIRRTMLVVWNFVLG